MENGTGLLWDRWCAERTRGWVGMNTRFRSPGLLASHTRVCDLASDLFGTRTSNTIPLYICKHK